ncbi:TPA: hypothetical protein G9F26_004458 [Salmonella enterica]|uniref:Uncharacterized protein n=1 Tax=Salmonella enterica TaxID=28901 RepID=A0A750MRQ0_SALER|nr:hypothetical protein [Salmonella enterica]
MDQELNFSLCYEQLFQEAEGQIKKCDLREEGPYYLQELSKASGLLAFWHRLANRGYSCVGDYERVEADWQRLHALIYKRED